MNHKHTFSAVGSRSEESRDTCTTGADTLGKSALGGQLDLELTRQVLALKLLVLTNVTADHTLDLSFQKNGMNHMSAHFKKTHADKNQHPKPTAHT